MHDSWPLKYLPAYINIDDIPISLNALAQEKTCNNPTERANMLFERGSQLWSKNNNKSKSLIFKAIKNNHNGLYPITTSPTGTTKKRK